MPLAEQSSSLVLSRFSFHLMSDLDVVTSEIARIPDPGGRFAAVIGGGPRIGDAFELFIDLLYARGRPERSVPSIGERRGRTEDGLCRLFEALPAFDNELKLEDFYIDFGGTFDEVWIRLATVYETLPEDAGMNSAPLDALAR
ncbi:MAG: hypothetical protein GY811_12400 [Myxococcales bacterium]|nr:hypothetical protein [Myxococcales bacterium]